MLESHPAVKDLLRSWREALASENPDQIGTLITDEAEFWSQGQPPLRGRAALKDAFAGIFERYVMDQEFRCDELIVIEDWAFLRGLEVNRLTERESGEELVVRQRAFSVLRRCPQGVWRFHRGMTNEPPEAGGGP